jgi:hypothetical protein
VFDLFIEDGEGKVVGPVVLSCRYVADVRVAPHRTPLGLEKDFQDRPDIPGILRKFCRGAGREVVEVDHVIGELAAKLVYPRDKGFKVVSILDPGCFSDLLDTFTLEIDKVEPENGSSRKLSARLPRS